MAMDQRNNKSIVAAAYQQNLSLSDSTVKQSDILSPCFAVAFDIDGVLVRGKDPLPVAKEALDVLRLLSIPYIFLTNGGGHTEGAHAKLLASRLDVPVAEEQFIQSHTPFRQFASRYEDQFVLVLGGSGDQMRRLGTAGFPGAKILTDSDLTRHYPHIHPFPELTREHHEKSGVFNGEFQKNSKISAIFVFSSPRDWCLDLQLCTDLLLSEGGRMGTRSKRNGDPSLENYGYQQDGQPALYFCNPDLEWATRHDQPRLAQGAFRAALEGIWAGLTQGRAPLQAWTCGKPTQTTYKYAEAAIQKYHARTNPRGDARIERVYMVGDGPRSDIQGALVANEAEGEHPEWFSVLVESGIYKAGSVPEYQPTMIKATV